MLKPPPDNKTKQKERQKQTKGETKTNKYTKLSKPAFKNVGQMILKGDQQNK